MIRKIIAVALVLVQLLFAVSCSGIKSAVNSDNEQPSADYPMTIADATGQELVLYEKPQRVAVLFSSYADIWNLAGGSIAITVGDSVKRGFVDDSVTLVDSGAGLKLNLELLIAADPDFVIGTADFSSHRDAQDFLSKLGIPCVLLREESLEDYLSILRLFCMINGSPSYATYGSGVEEKVQSILSSDSNKFDVRYLFIRAGSSLSATKAKTAQDHFACAMLDQLGADNIADDNAMFTQDLSIEYILMHQPDIIFITTQGDENEAKSCMEELFSQDGWKEVSAVKQGNVIYLPKEYFHYKPNASWADAYEYLVTKLQELVG